MKSVPLIGILLLCSLKLYTQDLSDPTGTWRVDSVVLNKQLRIKEDVKADLQLIANGMKLSILHLGKNGKAEFDTRVPQLVINDAKWTYDAAEGRIVLSDRKSAANLMYLLYMNKGLPVFYMEQSPFILHVTRIKDKN